MEREGATASANDLDWRLILAGAAYWCHVNLVSFQSIASASVETEDADPLWMLVLVGNLIALALLAVVPTQKRLVDDSRWVWFSFGAAASGACLSIIGLEAAGPWAARAGTLLGGAGAGVVLVLFSELFAQRSPQGILFCAGLQQLIAAPLCSAIALLPRQTVLCTAIILAFVQTVLLATSRQAPKPRPSKTRTAPWLTAQSIRPVLGMSALAVGLCYGSVMTLALPQAQSIPPSLTLLVGSASGGALLAASSRLLHRKNPEEYLFQVAVPLLALGLASMPLLTAGVPIALPALLACSAYFFGLLWFFVALTDDGIRTGSLAATSLLAFLFGHLAGRVIVEFGPAPLRDAPTISIGLLLMVVFLLVLYIAKYKRYERELVERAERQDFEQTCDNVAQAFGLTQREASVLRLIALGFSTKKVASKLVLSDSTVKTHVRHVYAKLEVHSRDELGDVLRDWANRHPLLERTGKTAISSLNDDMVSPKSTPFDE